jgi:hypothetical protein
MVWRRMHSAGGIGLDNGVWILPYSEAAVQFLQEMKTYVENQGGASNAFLSTALDPATETEVLARFQHDRAEEYFELVEQCQDFMAEIEKESSRQNFSFAEYEENEQDLIKLENWFEKVQQRDFIKGGKADEAANWLEKCRQALQCFATEVFDHEEPGRPSESPA